MDRTPANEQSALSRWWSKAERLLDRCVHPETLSVGGEELRRARIFIAAALPIVLSAPIPAVKFAFNGHPERTLIILSLWLVTVVLMVFVRLGAPVTRLGSIYAAVMITGLGAGSHMLHGLDSPPANILLILPMVVVFVASVRRGQLAALVVAALYISLAVDAADTEMIAIKLISRLATLAILVISSCAFEIGRIRAQRIVEAERARAEAANLAKSQFLANMSHVVEMRENTYSTANTRLSVPSGI